ncbi:sodium:solute symporter family protein [Hirschia litorea]|uniref:Sodium:solute symporter family protein n=1 Tax=Hirschia litorea TaxID=1199156 RepID=A0ABW2IPL8_9PROT
MSQFDIIVAALFSIVVLAAGLAFAKLSSGSGTKSFFAGGGAVPWWVSGLSLYMSFFSVGTFVVWGSIAYTDGLVAVAIQSTMCLAGVIIGFLIAPRWNKTNVMTAAEYIGDRLGENTKTIYTALFLLSSMVGMGGWLYPVGKIVEVSTGVPLEMAILFLAGFILLYAVVGGLWAVLVTDILQFVVLSAAIIIVVPLSFAQVGGISGFVEQAPERFFNLTNSEYNIGFMIAFLIYNTVFIGGHWGYVQRFTTVDNPKSAQKVAWLFAALYLFSPIVWMLPPMIYRIMEPDLSGLANEGAYMLVSKAVLPAGILGLMITAMVFATASSVNTVLNISAAVFTNDIYKSLRKSASEKHLLTVGRISTAVLGVTAIGSAFLVEQLGGIVNMILSISAIIGGSLFMPPIWTLFSRRQTAFSILTVTFISLSANIGLNFIPETIIGLSLDRSSQMLFGVFFPMALLLAFELLYIFQNREDLRMKHYDSIYKTKHDEKLAIVEEASEENADNRATTIIGTSIAVVGVLIVGLGLLAPHSQITVISTGSIIILAGALLVAPTLKTKFK